MQGVSAQQDELIFSKSDAPSFIAALPIADRYP